LQDSPGGALRELQRSEDSWPIRESNICSAARGSVPVLTN
jgi:hypothetical protein